MVAANAVMAGAKPDYFPAILALASTGVEPFASYLKPGELASLPVLLKCLGPERIMRYDILSYRRGFYECHKDCHNHSGAFGQSG